jgi:hypothetical protein
MDLLVKTISGRTLKMNVNKSDTLEKVLDKILAQEGIQADEIVFTAEQKQQETENIQATPDLFDSEELRSSQSQQSDPLWTPGSTKCSQEKVPPPAPDTLFLVRYEALKSLFSKCRQPGCAAEVLENDICVLKKGAGLKISTLCSNLHFSKWQSAEFINNVSIMISTNVDDSVADPGCSSWIRIFSSLILDPHKRI